MPKHTPAQLCDCINPATGRRHREILGDPPYHCAAEPAPRQWKYPTCTSHPTAERTHWNGTSWVEPPDGEAAPPHPPLAGWSETDDQLCAGLTGEPMHPVDVPAWECPNCTDEHSCDGGCWPGPTAEAFVSTHAFNRAVDASVARTQAISGQRGQTYQDTWSEANLRTSFLDATLRSIAEQQGHHGADIELAALTPAERRLIVVASLCDVKLSRLIGEWKQDHVDDLENYAGAWNTWMGEYLGQGEATA